MIDIVLLFYANHLFILIDSHLLPSLPIAPPPILTAIPTIIPATAILLVGVNPQTTDRH